MEKLFFYDLETTGLNSSYHGIHQISGAIVINGEIKERFDFKVKPFEKVKINERALSVGNVTVEQLQGYESEAVVYSKLVVLLTKYISKFDKLDKLHLVGYNNASFDNNFLRAFFLRNEDKYFGSYFWSDCIDVFCLASNHFRKERANFVDFKQKTVAQYCGVQIDEKRLHEAQYDIELCIAIFNFVNNTQDNKANHCYKSNQPCKYDCKGLCRESC